MRQVVIIGSGPAGLTAAIYSGRANLRPLVVEGTHAGGQLTMTTEVENYPGFHHAIMGPDLIKEMRAQAERFGTEFRSGEVTAADLKGTPLTLTIDGGHTAMEEANFLARFASKISVVHRRDKLRASKIMQDRAFKNEKIAFIWNSIVEEIYGDGTVSGVRLRNVVTNRRTDMKAAGVFVAIGHVPNTRLFDGQLEMDGRGYILTRKGMG